MTITLTPDQRAALTDALTQLKEITCSAKQTPKPSSTRPNEATSTPSTCSPSAKPSPSTTSEDGVSIDAPASEEPKPTITPTKADVPAPVTTVPPDSAPDGSARCNIDRKQLAEALTNLTRVITNRTPLPVLECIRVDIYPGLVKLTATDLEIWSIIQLEPVGETIPGTVLIPARTAKDLVGAGETTMIRQIDATNVEIAGVTLTTPAVEDYPAAPKIDPDVGLVGFDEADDMMGHIQRVAACASTDDARPVLTVVAFDSFEDHLRVVTTDSYRLAYSDTPVPYSPKHMRARSHPKGPRWEPWIVPVRAFTKTGLVYLSSISFNETWAVMAGRTKTLDVIMYVRLAEGTYPNYSQLLPENKPDENKPEWKVKAQLTIDAKSLLARLKTLKAIAADHIPIRFTVDAQGDLDVFAIRQDVGQSHGFVPATLEGELEDAVAFNSKYLASVVQAGRTPAKTTGDVVFEIISPLQPAIVTVPGIDGYRALLMPVKCRDRG